MRMYRPNSLSVMSIMASNHKQAEANRRRQADLEVWALYKKLSDGDLTIEQYRARVLEIEEENNNAQV